MKVIVIGTFVLAVLAMRITRYFDLEKWVVSLALIGLAAVLYVVNVTLIQYYIKKRAPDFASGEEVVPGVQTWELTAGLGVVPRWVSVLGLLSVSALITAVLPWLIELVKR